MTTIEQLEKHFKIRKSASSIMIKENDAEVFTEEQLKRWCNIALLRRKRWIRRIYNLRFLQKAQIMMCIRNALETYSFEYIAENIIVFKDIYEVGDIESEIDFKLIEEIGEDAFILCGMK